MRDMLYFHKGVEQVVQEHVMPFLSVRLLCNTVGTKSVLSDTGVDTRQYLMPFYVCDNLKTFSRLKLDVHIM